MPVTNVFAIFYVVAQVIERIVELLKNGLGVYDETSANIKTAEMKIEDQKKMIEKARDANEDLDKHYKTLNELLMAKNKMDNKMVWHFFIYTSVLGILAAWILQIRFLTMLEPTMNVNPTLDTIVTGLVVGSGTKPLHDLIKYIEKAKS